MPFLAVSSRMNRLDVSILEDKDLVAVWGMVQRFVLGGFWSWTATLPHARDGHSPHASTDSVVHVPRI